MASPLRVTEYFRPYSGTFTSNNHDIRARNWYNYVTQNATMTINLGTTSLTIDYRYRSGDRNYSSSYGDLILNNASSTIIMAGRYWYDYSESYWPRVMIDNTLSNYSYHSFGPHGNFGLIKSVTPSEVRFQSSHPRGGSSIPFYINHLEVTSSAQFSGNVSFTTLKLLGNGSIYTFAGGKTYSVSETFIIGQADGCAITTVKSNSPGTAANLVSSATVTSTYLDIQDISFTGVGSQGSNNVSSDLAFYVDASKATSYNGTGNTWNDISGNGKNGTITGASYSASNNSFIFDGSNDHVTMSSAVLAAGQASYTIEAYFKPYTNHGGEIYGQGKTSTSNSISTRGSMLLRNDGRVGFIGSANDYWSAAVSYTHLTLPTKA